MQDGGQRVARSRFCPDVCDASKQIQIECCRGAAHFRRKVPNWNKLTFLQACRCRFARHLPLTAANDAGFNPPKVGANSMTNDADVIVVGGGLSGLVAATEIADAGKRVIVVDQEGEQSLGGQAFWSFGGLFLVDSPEQRRLGIKDSFDLALQDWMGSAGVGCGAEPLPKTRGGALFAFAGGR